MKNHEEEKINPEQYWPDAEALLNVHFRTKKRRKIIIWFCILLLTAVGGLTVLNIGTKHTGVTSALSVTTTFTKEVYQQKEIKAPADETPFNATTANTSVTSGKKEIAIHKKENNTTTIASVNQKNIKRKKQIIPVVFANTSVNIYQVIAETENNHTIVENANEKGEDVNTTSSVTTTVRSINNEENDKADIALLSTLPVSLLPQNNIADGVSYKDSSGTGTKSRWDILFYYGVAQVDKDLGGISDKGYFQRRKEEEKGIILPYSGVQLSKSFNNWDIRAGVELAILGEEVNYTPRSKGNYFLNKEEWQQYQHTVTDTDSAYVFGVLFLNTHNILRTDSILTTKTDTLYGMHDDQSILNANGTNRRYIVEIPVEATYMISRGKFGIGISAGVAPGMVVHSKGNYLLNDESGTASLSEKTTRQFTVNARAGVEFSYLIGSRWRVMLRPSARMYLSNITEVDGASNQYRGVGINAGIIYKFW